MNQFNIMPLGKRIAVKPVVHEGRFRGGVYHLIEINRDHYRARYIAPEKFKDPQFVEGWDQRVPQGRMVPGESLEIARAKGGEFMTAGEPKLREFVRANPGVLFISDASNNPFNEGHFAIAEGRILPLPPNSFPLQGRHYVFSTAGGEISFSLIDVGNEAEVRSIEEGFFLSKIIYEGKPIDLLDEVPGTGRISIANFRGHIGQIFKENEYSQMNSLERIEIHSQLIEYLRDPVRYFTVLQNILSGGAHDFGKHGKLILKQNTYAHTYWIETDDPMVCCLKTYPSSDGKSSAGVTFSEGPHFLLALAKEYNIHIRNAFIGTNGRDVRIIMPKDGNPEALTSMIDGISLGDYFKRPLASFVAFYPSL